MLSLLMLATAATGPAPAIMPNPAPVICRPQGGLLVRDTPRADRAQKLGELPPANLELTVLNMRDGCQEPAIVRYGIGPTGR